MPDLVIVMVMVGSSYEERLTNFSKEQYQADILTHHQKGKKKNQSELKSKKVSYIKIDKEMRANSRRGEVLIGKKEWEKLSRQTWVTSEQSQGLYFIFLI